MVQQITWQNVNAPDVTGAADILARATNAFGEVGDGIKTNLQDFRKQQMINRSAAAYPLLAGVNSGGNVDQILGQIANTVKPQDMTPELQTAMLAARGLGVGYDGTRATTNSVNGANNRAQQTQDRAVLRENQLAAMTPAFMAAQRAALSGDQLPASLVTTESGGNDSALNSAGYGGRVQMGDARLADAAAAGVIDHPMTGAEYSRQPREVQAKVEAWQASDINAYIKDQGLDGYIGKVVNGVVVTAQGMQAVAHLGGKDGLRQYLQSNGKYDPADTNGTSLTDYMGTHGAAAIQAPNVPDFSGSLQAGNLLTPDDVKGFTQSIVDSQRTTTANRQADEKTAIDEAQRVKDAAATAQTANIDRQAKQGLEEIMKGVGPGGMGGDPTRQARDAVLAQNLPPPLRDAMLAKIPEYVAAATPGYAPPIPLAADEHSKKVDAVLSQLHTNNGMPDPVIAGLTNAGILEDPSKPVAHAIAPDGSQTAPLTDAAGGTGGATGTGDLAGATTGVTSAITNLVGGKQSDVVASTADVTRIVQELYDEHKGAIPKAVIMAMAGQAMTGGSARGYFLRDNILYLDKGKLNESLSPIDTPAKYRTYVESARLKALDMEQAKMLAASFTSARTEADFWSRSTSPDAAAKKADAEARMASIEKTLGDIAEKDAAKQSDKEAAMGFGPKPGEQTPEEKAAQDRSDAQAAKSQSDRAAEVLAAESTKPTPDGLTVDPAASALDQSTQRNRRNTEIDDRVSNIQASLDWAGGGPITGFVGSMVDYTRSAADAKKAASDRDAATKARDWFGSEDAKQMFKVNPQLLVEADKNPVGFYTNNILSQGERSAGQQPMSAADSVLAANASQNGSGDVTAQAKAAAVPVSPKATLDAINLVQTKLAQLKTRVMPAAQKAALQTKYLAEYQALLKQSAPAPQQ